jgi:hypothetical protein
MELASEMDINSKEILASTSNSSSGNSDRRRSNAELRQDGRKGTVRRWCLLCPPPKNNVKRSQHTWNGRRERVAVGGTSRMKWGEENNQAPLLHRPGIIAISEEPQVPPSLEQISKDILLKWSGTPATSELRTLLSE